MPASKEISLQDNQQVFYPSQLFACSCHELPRVVQICQAHLRGQHAMLESRDNRRVAMLGQSGSKWRVAAGCSWLQSRLPRVSFWSRFGPLVVSLLFCCSLPGTSAVYFGDPTLAIAPQMHDTPIRLMPALLADSRDMEAEFGEITYIN